MVELMAIAQLFQRLKSSPSGHAYTVLPVPGRDGLFLGMDSKGRPSMFSRTIELETEPPLHTSQVSLHVGQEYTVTPPGEPSRTERFDALCCETAVAADVDTFLILGEAFLSRHNADHVDRDALVAFFRSMIRLFSVGPSRDLQNERQGLWGELYMMKVTRGFQFWAPFWHSETTRKFDFSCASKRVEVKSAIGEVRMHHFAHRQIYALEGEEIFIVSLLLRKEEAGLDLRTLIREAREALQATEHLFKLERAVRQAGMEAMDDPGPAYDDVEAAKGLACFRATDAPHFTMPEPPGVSQTQYRVDLSTAPRVAEANLETWIDDWKVPMPAVSS